MYENIVQINRGSDRALFFIWRVGEGESADRLDLTGSTVSLIDVTPGLAGKITTTVTTAAQGEFTVFIEGTDPLPVALHGFRVQVTDEDGLSLSTPVIGVNIQ